jgi:hypothetical protein
MPSHYHLGVVVVVVAIFYTCIADILLFVNHHAPNGCSYMIAEGHSNRELNNVASAIERLVHPARYKKDASKPDYY